MAPSASIEKELIFYGAYHSNRINILIHIICVPLILWSAFAMVCNVPMPLFMPSIHHELNKYLVLEANVPAFASVLLFLYYYTLDPVAALLYAPQLALMLMTATAFHYHQRAALSKSAMIHVVCWIAQFIGHGFAEGRAPALFDNILAIAIAPFFVHLELLFFGGYKPELHKRIKNGVGVEIARIKREEAEKKRAAGKKEL